MRFMPSHGSLAAAAAGALNTLAFAPFGAWPLAILSPLALYVLLRGLTPRGAAWRGLAYGFGFWLSGVCWVFVSIHTYGDTPLVTAALLTGAFALMLATIFFAWWTALYAWLARGVLRPALFVAIWLVAEWMRSWLLTGFPWLYQGYAFIDTPLAGWAPVLGVPGVSAAVLAIAVLTVDLVRGTRRARLAAAVIIAALALGGWGLQHVRWTEPAGPAQRVSLVQGNIPQDMKWLLEMQKPTLDIYETLSEPEWGRDIVIWPESAIPLYAQQAMEEIDKLDRRAADTHTAFITGIPYVEKGESADGYLYHNSVVTLGEAHGIYHKVKLVPFGEVIPFAPLLRAIAPFFSLPQFPLEGFTPGSDTQPPLPAANRAMATFLCYEIVYPDYVRRHALGADYLLTVSNDAWFGTSHGPLQHFQIARMRALETGRWLLRGTNTGVTAIIDDRGRIVARAPQFERTVLRGAVVPMRGETPFMVAGEWPLLLVAVVICWRALRRRQGLPASSRGRRPRALPRQ